MILPKRELDSFIDRTLAEDLGDHGDITGDAVIPPDARFSAAMVAREPLVVAGLGIALAIVRRLAPDCRVDVLASDGTEVAAGATLARIEAPARGLLAAERAALNTVQHLSGIATLTRAYVGRIAGTGAVLLDTRKTLPGLRKLEKYAARIGGARNHRMGLYDAVLIKDNHIALAGGVTAAITAARRAGHAEIEVECESLDQVDEALAAGATRLLLDNMNTDALRQAVRRVNKRVPLEASGGVTLKSVHDIAETGVEFISVGRITQSAPAVDIGLDYHLRDAE